MLETRIKLAAPAHEEGEEEGELANVFEVKDEDDLELCGMLLHQRGFMEEHPVAEDVSFLTELTDAVSSTALATLSQSCCLALQDLK